MPGPTIMSSSSIEHGTVEDAGTVPTQKKGIIGRIKSKLSKNFGRRKLVTKASPTQQDLAKTELETPEVVPDQQQNEEDENNENGDDKEHSNHEQQQSQSSETEIEGISNDCQTDSVLHFNASLPTLESIVNEIDKEYVCVSSVKESLMEYEQKRFETPELVEEDNHVDEDEHEEGEVVAFHCETPHSKDKLIQLPEEQPQQTPESESVEDEDDTLEVFNNVEGNQNGSPLEPEDDNEGGEECHENVAEEYCPNDSSPQLDLVIVGVTPMALRNHTPCDDVVEEEEDPLETEPDGVSTPRMTEPLSSPLKRVRPGPAVVMMSPRKTISQSNNFPHPPLHDIREEDGSISTSDRDQAPAIPQRFEGRRRALIAPEAMILSSASPQCDSPAPNRNTIENDGHHADKQEDEAICETFDTGALIMGVFGERIVNLLGADPWGDRQDGFDAIKRAVKKANVSTVDPATRQRMLCATLAAVQCGVEDRVAPVMFCALECFRAVLKEFARVIPDEGAFADTESKSAAHLNTQLSSLVGAIVRKLGDSNKRTQREASQALVRIARLRFLRALPHLLLHLSGREIPPRRQLETLRRLMQEFGLTTSAEPSPQQQLTVETVLQFVAPSLKIAEEKTRKAAIEILADLQTRTGNSTAWHSQLARAGVVKPEMLRVITRRVEELLAKREQQQAATAAAVPVAGSAATNQIEQVDDEAAFPPAELVDVPQEDSQSSIVLLEASLHSAQNLVGPVCWRKLSSKTWSDRKDALLDVEKAMTEAKSDLRDVRPAFGSAAQDTFVAYSALLHRALGDSIAPVVNTALDAFATLIKIYGPRIEWRGANVRDVTLLTLLRLLSAMQKPNTRTTRAACRGVLKLARLPNARHPLRYVLSCVFGGEGSSACDPQVQMHLLRLLVPEFGFQADGLGASRVLDAVSKGLTHNSARVRRSAADVALSAQRLLGRDFVLARLQGVKPVTLKELEKSFVDGVGGSGGGERPQTVHATAVEPSAPAAIESSDLPPISFGKPGEFSSRRLLHSAPVGIGRLQCTLLHEDITANPGPQSRPLVLSNEEENLMDSILGEDTI